MPFTPAHSALVLPFLKSRWRFVSPSSLVIGSLTPDFEYFLRIGVKSIYSHTFAGLFYFDLPVAVLLVILFHLVIKHNLILNLPAFLQTRFQPLLAFDFVSYVRDHLPGFLLCCLLGAASHLLWDNFTHSSGYFVRNLHIYKTWHITFFGVQYPLFFALQQISTLAGLSAISLYIIFLKRQATQPPGRPASRYWLMIIAVTLAVGLIKFSIHHKAFNLADIVITFISGFCIALILAGLRKTKFKTGN